MRVETQKGPGHHSSGCLGALSCEGPVSTFQVWASNIFFMFMATVKAISYGGGVNSALLRARGLCPVLAARPSSALALVCDCCARRHYKTGKYVPYGRYHITNEIIGTHMHHWHMQTDSQHYSPTHTHTHILTEQATQSLIKNLIGAMLRPTGIV